jgi:hypothetical protein
MPRRTVREEGSPIVRPRSEPALAVTVRSTLAVVPSTLAVLAFGVVVLAAGLVARGAPQLGPPTLAGLTVGARDATPAELTAAAADTLETALTRGPGITFEIVQTAMVVARPGGPLVEIPDPVDPAASMGTAERYALGTLIERGLATPDGFWSELIHGPAPGDEAAYDLATAQVSRQALVLDGVMYRDDGPGWHETDQLPGIGLDPVTVAKLPELLVTATETKDVPPTPAAPPATSPPADDELAKATIPLDAAQVATRIDGLVGAASDPIRTLEGTTAPATLPGIIAADLEAATELLGPARLAFDEAGRLIGLTVTARNTHLDVHDLVVETHITFRYPDVRPELPKPEPAYVAPTPGADEEDA